MEALLTVLAALVLFTLFTIATVAILALLGVRSVRKRNRVSPSQPSPAPTAWLASPAHAARLHRRLRSAASVATMIQQRHAGEPAPPRAVEMAREAEQQAVALDANLAMAGRIAMPQRRQVLKDLEVEVNRVEMLVSRLSVLDAQSGAAMAIPHHGDALDELAHQLDLLEAARAEIDSVEAANGLEARPPYVAPAPGPAASTEPRRQPGH